MKIAVIGHGNVGRTLGLGWAARGHEVTFGVRDVEKPNVQDLLEAGQRVHAFPLREAVAGAEIICLATPYPAALEFAAVSGDVSGKIVVDCTNPIGPGLVLSVGHESSGAEEIARSLPTARVVKAFNSTGWENMADSAYPGCGGLRPVMPVCGDDADARQVVCRLSEDLGFEAWDWGPLAGARYLEPLAMLWIIPARAGGVGPDFAFALLKR
jgi:predicted dinucleotide-binding enzyme